MFGKAKEAQKHIDELNETIRLLTARLANSPILTGIGTEGRSNVFTFVRRGEVVTVKTYSTMSDPLPQWRQQLLGD